MRRSPTPVIGRRTLIISAASGLLLPVVPGLLRGLGVSRAAAQVPGIITTPAQTEGPFYPVEWAGDADNDLVQVTGEDRSALGTVTHISGRVSDVLGVGIAGASVEIWQCDSKGVYHHPRDLGWFRKIDQTFQGRGRCATDAKGDYSFRTIRPVAYPGRTPHIHFKITIPGGNGLVTQMYVDGDPGNERDGVLNGLRDASERAAVIVRLDPAGDREPGALAGVFNIVIA